MNSVMVIFQCKRGALYISVLVCVCIKDNIFYNFLFLKFIYLLTYYFVRESYFVSQHYVSVKRSEDNFLDSLLYFNHVIIFKLSSLEASTFTEPFLDSKVSTVTA